MWFMYHNICCNGGNLGYDGFEVKWECVDSISVLPIYWLRTHRQVTKVHALISSLTAGHLGVFLLESAWIK